jgi:hypothetical protein
VKFVVDNQLPSALAEYLRRKRFDCQHVLEAGLGDARDTEIYRHAELHDRRVPQVPILHLGFLFIPGSEPRMAAPVAQLRYA